MGQKIEIAQPSELFKPFIQYYKYIEADLTGIYKIVHIPFVELYFNFTRLKLLYLNRKSKLTVPLYIKRSSLVLVFNRGII